MTEAPKRVDVCPAYHAAIRLMYALDDLQITPEGAKGAEEGGRVIAVVALSPDAAATLAACFAPLVDASRDALPDDLFPEDPYDTGLARVVRELDIGQLWVEPASARLRRPELRLRGIPEAMDKLTALIEGLGR